ncbi:MAG: helix-turn-helix transcriptional regulator [Erysipelotrichaceae bacterium]|nr:helix-turn-helix transcriptional regulator [Erysipelotrichaceae bacterium]
MKPIQIEPEIHDLKALEDDLINQLVETRKSYKLSQAQYGKICQLPQSVIGRIETKATHPCISTIIKLLAPVGKTIKVVDIEESH